MTTRTTYRAEIIVWEVTQGTDDQGNNILPEDVSHEIVTEEDFLDTSDISTMVQCLERVAELCENESLKEAIKTTIVQLKA